MSVHLGTIPAKLSDNWPSGIVKGIEMLKVTTGMMGTFGSGVVIINLITNVNWWENHFLNKK